MRIGVGDDAAVFAPAPGMEYVVTVDMLVEGRHFRADADPERLGHKTLAVNLSDLAAMGARRGSCCSPARCQPPITAGSPRSCSASMRWRAIRRRADRRRHDARPAHAVRHVIGELPAGTALTRGGASPGDIIYVSGSSAMRRSRSPRSTAARCRAAALAALRRG